MRMFNVTGTCVASKHYMVDITNKLEQIKAMIDNEFYFTINRGRQYGKTTTLLALEEFLQDEYTVISLSFEGLGEESFADEKVFCQTLLEIISRALRFSSESADSRKEWLNPNVKNFMSLDDHITDMCEDKKLVLMIDEVDKTSNNKIFLNFLSTLRTKYLARLAGKDFTFHSVILAGVYDIRNIRLKLVQEGLHTPASGESVIYNSPWNIATNFDVDMSFSATEIETMLTEYERDYNLEMDITKIAEEIYQFTNGYPVLVSRICKNIDEELDKIWTVSSVRKAVKLVLKEDSPLFQSLVKNLTSNAQLSDLIYSILMDGFKWSFNLDDPFVVLGARYGYFREVNGRVKISNKIFEIRLTNYFISEKNREEARRSPTAQPDEEGIITNGKFNMQTCLEKFAKYYHQYYNERDINFLEREARQLFLLFASSVLNGGGFAQIESGLTDNRSMDIVITYQGEQFIIETKIWRGEARHSDGYKQLLGYMDKMNLTEGYLLTFDFRQNKKAKKEWIKADGNKKIFDIIV